MQNTTQPLQVLLIRLWQHITVLRRWQFFILLILMIITSFAEILSIGVVLPFLGVLTMPDHIFEHPVAQPLIQMLGLKSSEQLLLPLTITFGVASVTAGAMRLLLLWASTRLSFSTGADLSISIYRRTLYQPYAVHISRNSSEVISGITGKANGIIYNIILPILNLLSSTVMLSAILIALLFVDPKIAVLTFGGFGLIYLIIIRITRKRLISDGLRIAHESTQLIKSLQEGLGGIRDVLIDGSQASYCKVYQNADKPLRRAQGDNILIIASPRFAMEALGMVLIAVLAYILASQPDGIAKIIPVLGAIALGAQRLLPILQLAYGSWSSLRGGQASLQDTLELLDQPIPNYADMTVVKRMVFQEKIELKKLSFRYSHQTPWVFKNLNLTIVKGSRIGFIGKTGSGKSTLLDIVMALLSPTEGTIEIDGKPVTLDNHREWQAHIAHVPQAVFLADGTVAENIAFGVPKDAIDHERILYAAQQAQIAEVIETLPNGYQTFVGERGVRLSGGQQQRIGIARALYKRTNVIIFDEATSALDGETEQAIMQAIEGLSMDLTVLIIAHRLTTLKNCTQVVELGNSDIKHVHNY